MTEYELLRQRFRTRLGLRRAGLLAGVFGGLLLVGVGQGAAPGKPGTIEPGPVLGFTAPARMATLGALTVGRITDLPAEEGAQVRAGDVLVQLHQAVQERRVSIALAAAESTHEIALAETALAHVLEEVERLEALRGSAATTKELADVRNALRTAELSLQQAQFRHAQAQRELELQRALLAELNLRAPFDGVVAAHLREIGDTVAEREGILQLVQLDPLLVIVDCPINIAAGLRLGQRAQVLWEHDAQPGTVGVVAFISPVIDAGSQTCRVKLHVPNEAGAWRAGLKVYVHFGDDAATRPVTRARESQP